MEPLVYVSGNFGKIASVKKHCIEKNLNIEFFDYDCEELDVNDIELISKQKVMDAYQQLQRPCFVSDTGFYIDHYPGNPGYPGAFVKRSGVSSNLFKLLSDMKNVEQRSCHFLDCLTFYDGEDFYIFYGKTEGVLSRTIRGSSMENAKSNLWKVFIPQGQKKTLAEMNEEDYLVFNQGREVSATVKFLDFYTEKYLSRKAIQFIKTK